MVQKGIDPCENEHWQNFAEADIQTRYQAVMENFWWYGYSKANQAQQDDLKAEWNQLTRWRKELKATYTCPP